MPELPEVETVRRGLMTVLEGRRLSAVSVRRPNLRRPFPPDFACRLQGRRITALGRRAKYLTLALDDGWVVLVHLGMSGSMVIADGDTPPGKHDHVIFDTEEGRRVIFHDPRRFGLMDLVRAEDLAGHPLLRGLGPEPLDESFTPAVLMAALAKRSGPVKAVLLDQTVVAGIGNIYASEALFRAGICPTRSASGIDGNDAVRLTAAIKEILTAAIKAGGSSLRDHRQPSGELGYFQFSFAVYGREGQPCPGCTCQDGIKRIIQAGRSTFYCEKKQH